MKPFIVNVDGTNQALFLAGTDIKLSRISSQILSSYFLPIMGYVIISWISFTIPKQIVRIILTHKMVTSLSLYLNSLHRISARNLGCQVHRKSILGAGCEQSRIVFCATYSMYLRIRCNI